jgi:phospho-N-acetylmuramoyl-pentapeptide-transferase
LNGVIGIADDLMKLKRKQNEGVSASVKFLLQLGVASAFVVMLSINGIVYTELYLPFVKQTVYIGNFYYPFALVFLTGFTNSVNLTDGLDGLCSSVSGAVCMFFALLAINAGDVFGSVIPVGLLAGVLAFLIYNFYPAKVFMGDTGSLFIGGAISGLALVSGKATLLLIVGGIYLFEAFSVILQVLYYKLTKKRLFLMAPFHHHLEKRGHSEISIVFIFTAVTLVLGAVAYMFG